MKPVKNLLFTFDYELFLGRRSGNVETCLITPTNSVLNILNTFNLKGIFFVDTLFLVRLKNENNKKCKIDFNLISNQLKNIINQGHFVFPHIHPHWLDAVYLENIHQWDLSNTSKYCISSLPDKLINELFDDSFLILFEIFNKLEIHYEIDAYRAGGWSIQPFEKFRKSFDNNNIKNDFSVIPGFMADTIAQNYNFLNVPNKSVYNFKDDIIVEDINGKYKEFTISTLKFSKLTYIKEKLFLKLLFKLGDKGGFGRGESLNTLNKDSIIQSGEMASIELFTIPKVKGYLKFFENNNYMQFISHPKMFSNHNLKTLKKFLKNITSKYTIESDYRFVK
jgi:hypothetical protein